MGHSTVVALLLFWGCYVDSIDNEGRTVLSVAAAQGNTEVVRQLLDRGLFYLYAPDFVAGAGIFNLVTMDLQVLMSSIETTQAGLHCTMQHLKDTVKSVRHY